VPVLLQPMQWPLVQPTAFPHCWHVVYVGVPEHVGDTLNSCGGIGNEDRSSLQQIWPVQSLSWWHALAQVAEQTPLQQSWPVVVQSADVVHAFGQASYIGFKQSPFVFRLGSIVLTDVQQTSPLVVSHVLESLQAFGQRFAAVQIGVE
jgi:hypothetical protein